MLPVTLAAAAAIATASSLSLSGIRDVLSTAISNHVTPGLVAGIRDAFGNVIFLEAFGSLTYGEDTPLGQPNSFVTLDTFYDMASISKLIGPVSSAAYLYQLGYMPDLDELVSSNNYLGTFNYSQNGKETITLRNLLLHNSGYPPDPSPSYASVEFGCPATSNPSPPLTLSCQGLIFTNLMAQTLENPTGAKMVYSDLSMITLLFIVGRVVTREGLITNADFDLKRLPECMNASSSNPGGLFFACSYHAYWRKAIQPRLFANGVNAVTNYVLDHSLWPLASPTYVDEVYRNRIMQGDVSDANSYALGGLAGHAGIFSTIRECLDFTSVWQYHNSLLNSTTTSLWTRVWNSTFSSRALGWVTQASTDTYFGCGNMSDSTFYHTGYTGTLVCVDPVRNISTVLLTTRVYPNESNVPQIQALRQAFNNEVIKALDRY